MLLVDLAVVFMGGFGAPMASPERPDLMWTVLPT